MEFVGTTQKCVACDKIVYLVDMLTVDNRICHKACFRCHHYKGTLKHNLVLSHQVVKHVKLGCPNFEFFGLMTIGMPDYTSTLENFRVIISNMAGSKEVKEAIVKEISTTKVDAIELDLSSMASVKKFASKYSSSGHPLNLLM